MLSYQQAISAIFSGLSKDSVVVSGAGLISRVIYDAQDRPGNLYIQGAMGLSSAVGLGISLSNPDVEVIVIDGDGGTLMHLGTIATVGMQQPRNYLHIVLDNESHLSTGGQPTATSIVSLDEIALAAGYRSACTVYDERELVDNLAMVKGPKLICVKVSKYLDTRPPRPKLSPPDITRRFVEVLSGKV